MLASRMRGIGLSWRLSWTVEMWTHLCMVYPTFQEVWQNLLLPAWCFKNYQLPRYLCLSFPQDIYLNGLPHTIANKSP